MDDRQMEMVAELNKVNTGGTMYFLPFLESLDHLLSGKGGISPALSNWLLWRRQKWRMDTKLVTNMLKAYICLYEQLPISLPGYHCQQTIFMQTILSSFLGPFFFQLDTYCFRQKEFVLVKTLVILTLGVQCVFLSWTIQCILPHCCYTGSILSPSSGLPPSSQSCSTVVSLNRIWSSSVAVALGNGMNKSL